MNPQDERATGEPAPADGPLPDIDLTVVGLGYVGLPLARAALRAGLRVAGFDIAPGVVAGLGAGVSHIDDVRDDEVAAMLASGFHATGDPGVIGRSRTVVVCVPTPLGADRGPDLGPVRAAARIVGQHLAPGSLVVLESTTYPGTTEEVVRPLLESGGRAVAGVDFHLAYSPERVDPGNSRYGIEETPKVIGGLTPACTRAAVEFYGRFVATTVVAKGLREAEMSKLLENTYRNINIAFVNEMTTVCRAVGVDLWNAIDCAATKPFGYHAFYPGAGVGGHCIPVDPQYLMHWLRRAGLTARLVETAQEINAGMPQQVVNRVADLLNERGMAVNGAAVLLLGVTYKADVSDVRESPAFPVADLLRRKGAHVSFHDPYVAAWPGSGEPVPRAENLEEALKTADLTILLQPHRAYRPEVLTPATSLLDTCGLARKHDAAML